MKTATKQQLMKAIENHPMGKYLFIEIEDHRQDPYGQGRVILEVKYEGRIQLYDCSCYYSSYSPDFGTYRGEAYADIIERLSDPDFVCPMTEEVAYGLGIDL